MVRPVIGSREAGLPVDAGAIVPLVTAGPPRRIEALRR
jgi:hypothetical protein